VIVMVGVLEELITASAHQSITAAWCAKWEVPITRIFSKTLREKFPWALDVKRDWSFNDPPESDVGGDDDDDE